MASSTRKTSARNACNLCSQFDQIVIKCRTLQEEIDVLRSEKDNDTGPPGQDDRDEHSEQELKYFFDAFREFTNSDAYKNNITSEEDQEYMEQLQEMIQKYRRDLERLKERIINNSTENIDSIIEEVLELQEEIGQHKQEIERLKQANEELVQVAKKAKRAQKKAHSHFDPGWLLAQDQANYSAARANELSDELVVWHDRYRLVYEQNLEMRDTIHRTERKYKEALVSMPGAPEPEMVAREFENLEQMIENVVHRFYEPPLDLDHHSPSDDDYRAGFSKEALRNYEGSEGYKQEIEYGLYMKTKWEHSPSNFQPLICRRLIADMLHSQWWENSNLGVDRDSGFADGVQDIIEYLSDREKVDVPPEEQSELLAAKSEWRAATVSLAKTLVFDEGGDLDVSASNAIIQIEGYAALLRATLNFAWYKDKKELEHAYNALTKICERAFYLALLVRCDTRNYFWMQKEQRRALYNEAQMEILDVRPVEDDGYDRHKNEDVDIVVFGAVLREPRKKDRAMDVLRKGTVVVWENWENQDDQKDPADQDAGEIQNDREDQKV